MKKFAGDMLDFIYESPTPYNAVSNTINILKENGFKELKSEDSWKIEKGGKY